MAYGVDIGTTCVCIAKVDAWGIARMVEDPFGCRARIPVSAFVTEEGDLLLGEEAKEAARDEPKKLLTHFTRRIAENAGCLTAGGKAYTPAELLALLLAHIKERFEAHGEVIEDVVFSVPATFGAEQREAMLQAGKKAGMNVLGLIGKPDAAALCVANDFAGQERMLLICDLGGGTFSCSLVKTGIDEQGEPTARILALSADGQLGGSDWDDIMFDLLVSRLCEKTGLPSEKLDKAAVNFLKCEAENAKHLLRERTDVAVRVRIGDVHHCLTVTAKEFEEAGNHLLAKIEAIVDDVLACAAKMGIGETDIDCVPMTGGGSYMKPVCDMLCRRFPGKPRLCRPEHAAALGAAIAAERLGR